MMKSRTDIIPAIVFVCAILAAGASPLGATDVFKARMLTGKAPVEPPQVNVRIEVENWTTVEEIRRLNDALVQSGVEAMLDAFSAMKKGVVRFMDARGWNLPIHAAQVLPTAKGKQVILVMNRQGWDAGSYQKPGRHYFMVIDLKLNEKGKGEGRFYEDAQIRLDTLLGKIEMETYESAPKLLPQVQQVIEKAAEKK